MSPAEQDKRPVPDEHGRVYAHEVVPDPYRPLDRPGPAVADVVRYHLARAQGFWAAMVHDPMEGPDARRWTDHAAAAAREMHLALLLAELEDGADLQAAVVRVQSWLEDGGAAGEMLYAHGTQRGIYMPGIRPYLPSGSRG